jgi:hypothetical protein
VIREGLMTLGSFDFMFDPDTPWTIRRHITEWSLLVVTPTWIGDQSLTKAELLDLSRYTGVVRVIGDQRLSIEGCGLAVLLGDEDGKADTYAISTTLAIGNVDDLEDMVDELLLAGNGITKGSIKTKAFPNTATARRGHTVRWILTDGRGEIWPWDGEEWRVNPDGTLDVDDPDVLFAATPTAIIGRGLGTADPILQVIPAEISGVAADVEDWTSGVYVYDSSGPAAGAATVAVNPYVDLAGNPLTMRRVVEGSDIAEEDEVAERHQAEGEFPRRSIDVHADPGFDVRRFVEPGDNVWLFDPDNGFEDFDNEVYVDGRPLSPEIDRVAAIEWNPPAGSGIFLVSGDGGDTVTDVTRFLSSTPVQTRIETGVQTRALDVLPKSQ